MDFSSRLFGRMTQSVDISSVPIRTSHRSGNSPSYEKHLIDPFDASPTSSSFFIDYIEAPILIPTPSPRPESSILGESTKPFSHLLFPRRERPRSVQTMPLPSQSRRSSFQYRTPTRDKYDRSWALEEEEMPSPVWIEDVEEAHDPAASIDWRQFHTDLLHDEQ